MTCASGLHQADFCILRFPCASCLHQDPLSAFFLRCPCAADKAHETCSFAEDSIGPTDVFAIPPVPKAPGSFAVYTGYTWASKGFPKHNFGVYVHTLELHGALGFFLKSNLWSMFGYVEPVRSLCLRSADKCQDVELVAMHDAVDTAYKAGTLQDVVIAKLGDCRACN